MTFEEITADQKLVGLRGWLGFFVFTIYLSAIVEAFGVVLVFVLYGKQDHSGLSFGAFLGTLIFLGASVAVELWFLSLLRKHKREAIESVKIYLVAQVILNFIANVSTADLSNSLTKNGVKLVSRPLAAGPVWWNVLSAFLGPTIWYFYFQRSRRVRLTLTK